MRTVACLALFHGNTPIGRESARWNVRGTGARDLIGFLIGFSCGAGELLLLRRLAPAVQDGKIQRILGILFLKLALFACALVPVILFARADLVWCGVGIPAALVPGAFFLNWRSRRGQKGE